MGLLKKIFIFTLFLFPLGEVIRTDLGNNIIIKPIDVGVGLVVFLWVIFKFKKDKLVKQKYIFFLILFFTVIGFFSLLVNYSFLSFNQFLASLMYLLRWITYAVVFFVVSNFDKSFKKTISNLLVAIGAFIVSLGYIQYFFYSNLRNLYYLGWDEHMYRMFSIFFDPNFAGAFFVLFFLFLTSIFLKKKSILIGLLLILTLGAVFLTFSRSALIMLLASSSLLFILINKKKWIVILLGITFLIILISSKYFNIENINLFRVVSSEARLETAKKAIEIIQAHPFFGVGFNAYRYAKLNYNLENNNAEAIGHADAGVDNSFLFVIATTGIVGFIVYLFLWFRILKIASILAIVSIVGVFVDSMFINSLFYPFIMLWLWIIIAIKENNLS